MYDQMGPCITIKIGGCEKIFNVVTKSVPTPVLDDFSHYFLSKLSLFLDAMVKADSQL